MKYVKYGCLLPALCVLAVSARAQEPALPPGLEQRPILTDPALDRQEQQRQLEERERRESADRIGVPALQGEPAPEQKLPEDTRPFTLQSIRFSPSHFIEAGELERIAADYVGRPVTFSDLNAMLAAINRIYTDRQLLTARAIIPPQTISNGELRVILVEAKLEAVEWERDPESVPRSFFTDRVQLSQGEVLDTSVLMQDIQRLNDTSPGPQLSASLAAGETFGTTRVHLSPYEPERLGWWLYANNYGSESSGTNQAGVTGQWFSPAGRADNLILNALVAEGRLYGDLEYQLPVSRSNGQIVVGVSRSTLDIIDGPYRDLDIEGDSLEWRAGFSQPWWVKPGWLLNGRIEGVLGDSDTTVEHSFKLSDTRLETLRLTGSVQFRGGPWFWRYDQKLEYVRSDERLSGMEGDFHLARGSLFLQRRLGEDYRVVVRGGWQYASDDNLPSALLYQIGGPSSVRGYESGILTAAHGVDLGLEGYMRVGENWEVSLLADAGHVKDEDLPKDSISSLGMGLQYGYGDSLTVQALYAKATNEVVPDQDSGQFLMQLSWRL